MPEYAVATLADTLGDLRGARVVVLGAAYRGGVKEAAFSGVFPTVVALTSRGAQPVVHDPMYTDDELQAMGLNPYHLGDAADAVIVQTDHAEYRDLGAESIPGVKVLIDGRRITDPARWPGVTRRVLGVA
jgi:UDP-N-acetyl-D-mannosaminuronate dehydrogenase